MRKNVYWIAIGVLIGVVLFLLDGRKYFLRFSDERVLLGVNVVLFLLLGVSILLLIKRLIALVTGEIAYRRGLLDEHFFWNNVSAVVLCMFVVSGSATSLFVPETVQLRYAAGVSETREIDGRFTPTLVGCEVAEVVGRRVGNLEPGRVYPAQACQNLDDDLVDYVYDGEFVTFDASKGSLVKVLPTLVSLISVIPVWLIIRAVRDVLKSLSRTRDAVLARGVVPDGADVGSA